ncbi:MAG: hypothetical protein ACRDBG_07215 [Waterburya sp.]
MTDSNFSAKELQITRDHKNARLEDFKGTIISNAELITNNLAGVEHKL